ncbi:hypothetical protein BJ165DRAFT_1430221 [Panaeolus papilionaceus]|nr:hypothetical protein BJ165DRAFT_1430221 [Panaeolus papilionaceus]
MSIIISRTIRCFVPDVEFPSSQIDLSQVVMSTSIQVRAPSPSFTACQSIFVPSVVLAILYAARLAVMRSSSWRCFHSPYHTNIC